MPLVRGEYAEMLAPTLNLRTFEAWRAQPEIYRAINNVMTSDSAYEDDYAISGFGPLAPKHELGKTILDEPIKLGGVRFFHKKYALGFIISDEMRKDGKFNLMGLMSTALGRSSKHTVEIYGHEVWNHAFDTTYVGRDGLPLISATHPVPGTGGVISNRLANDADLSQAAIQAAWGNYQAQVDDRGIPIALTPQQLLINPAQELFARQLLESSSVVSVGANATVNAGITNPIQGMLRIISSVYLLDDDAFFILGAPNEIDVRFYWREMPDTKTWDDDDADGTIHKISQLHSHGFGDWRNTFGSPGT